MRYIPLVCDIYRSNSYNQKMNIVRVSVRFDEDDTSDLYFDVPLSNMGIYVEPDWRKHKVLVMFPEDDYKKLSITDTTIPVGSSNIIAPIGILIDATRYNKISGSIGHSSYGQKCNVGNQVIEDLDFFIPTGSVKNDILDDSEDIDDTEAGVRTCGIAGGKDGSIMLRGPTGEIVLGQDGIRMTGKVTQADGIVDKTDVFKNNPVSFIPATIVTPLPERLPNLNNIMSIAGIISGASNIASSIRSFTR